MKASTLPAALRSNIRVLYLSNLLTGTVFWYGIEKLFMQSIGINSLWISINAAVFLATTVLLDVPTGILADCWKRKCTLMLANGLLAVSSFLLGVSSGFGTYVIGTMLYAVFLVMTLTTYQAAMYDTLAEFDKQDQYSKYAGRAAGLMQVGIGLSSLAGGYIAQYTNLRNPFLWSVLPAVMNVLVLCFMREPRVHKATFDGKLVRHIKSSAKIIIRQPVVLHLSLFLVVASLLRSTTNEFNGLYYIALSFSAVAMGYANALKWIAGAIGHLLASRVGPRRAFAILPGFFVLFLLFSIIPHWSGTIFFLLAAGVYSLIANQAEATIQGRTPTELRATVLSINSFAANTIMVPLSILFGWIAQNYSVFRSFQLFAAIGLAYVVFWLLRGWRVVRGAETRTAYALAQVIEPVK